MNRNFIIIAAVTGALGVILGAFGAHGLSNILSPKMIQTYETGILYHLIHAVVLLSLSLSSSYNFKVPFYLILLGIVLFSFSLYVYSISDIKIFAIITPSGGVSLIIGWLLILTTVIKNSSK